MECLGGTKIPPLPLDPKLNLGCSEVDLQWLQLDAPPGSVVELGLQWSWSVVTAGCAVTALQWLQSDPPTLHACNFPILNIHIIYFEYSWILLLPKTYVLGLKFQGKKMWWHLIETSLSDVIIIISGKFCSQPLLPPTSLFVLILLLRYSKV